jgi:hypothetical protein
MKGYPNPFLFYSFDASVWQIVVVALFISAAVVWLIWSITKPYRLRKTYGVGVQRLDHSEFGVQLIETYSKSKIGVEGLAYDSSQDDLIAKKAIKDVKSGKSEYTNMLTYTGNNIYGGGE